MKKETYILTHLYRPIAVIMASNNKQLVKKTSDAIMEELNVDEEDNDFELHLNRIGDFGETTEVVANYFEDGKWINNEEFSIIKTINY